MLIALLYQKNNKNALKKYQVATEEVCSNYKIRFSITIIAFSILVSDEGVLSF